MLIALVICFAAVMTFRSVTSHAAGVSADIKSGVSGFCLDAHNDQLNNAEIDSWGCNGSRAQNWTVTISSIQHDNNYCLSVLDNGTHSGDLIVLQTCNAAAGQVWLRDQSGFKNPNSGLCLSLPESQTGKQLILASCNALNEQAEIWLTKADPSCSNDTKGQKIACEAIQEWTRWQSGTPSHEALLNSYTSQAPYEEWCADFVSYVYKEAGYPFTGGETNGWDENIASNIQYMGFTMHPASQYVPHDGDVAFFDYQGGHVEIVVSGGSTPTFVYGNSATIDPSTGNGQMQSNTITHDGSEGQIMYYLSPN
jgi:hypothetical protein